MANNSNNQDNIDLKLFLTQKENDVMSNVHKEILQEELDELVPIKENDINIAGVYIFEQKDNYEIKVYIRNGLKHNLTFGNICLNIINKNGEVLAKQTFDLSHEESIPSRYAKPLILNFSKDNMFVDKIDENDWKIVFDQSVNAVRNIDVDYENLPLEIDRESKKVYEDFLRQLPELKEGQVTFSKFSIGLDDEGDLLVTLVVRNGSNKTANIEKIPMTILNEKNEVVISDIFEMNDLKVSPYKAKVCNFKFTLDSDNVNVGLDNWSILYK